MRKKKASHASTLHTLKTRHAEQTFKSRINTISTTYASLDDYFEQPVFQKTKHAFIQAVGSHTLPSKAHLLDVGAGTGFYSEQLIQKNPDWKLDCIEPNKAMQQHLIKRLADRATLYCTYVQNILADLPQYDAILFQHSFFQYAPNTNAYKKLLQNIQSHLTPKGLLAIQEKFSKADLITCKLRYQEQAEAAKLDPDSFHARWSVLEQSIQQLNELIEDGWLMTFNLDEICDEATKQGYTVLEKNTKNNFALFIAE